MAEDPTPAPPQEAVSAPEPARETPELQALRKENAELRDQVLRFAADSENTKRRAERDANDARAYAIQKFAQDLLGVADNLASALAHEPADATDPVVKNFMVGVEMTEKQLQGAFERNGLKRIAPVRGDKFDPHLHQAMAEAPGDEVAPGGIVQVMQVGYELLGRLVRPAMVVVAARGATAAEPEKPKANGAKNPYADGGEDEAGGEVDTRA
jgi:molecular chaperone GrpE